MPGLLTMFAARQIQQIATPYRGPIFLTLESEQDVEDIVLTNKHFRIFGNAWKENVFVEILANPYVQQGKLTGIARRDIGDLVVPKAQFAIFHGLDRDGLLHRGGFEEPFKTMVRPKRRVTGHEAISRSPDAGRTPTIRRQSYAEQ
ncbi:hypothetical protein DMR_p1_00040 (plasmid) [Solidesulfovibrio magneticus RS-1]|uniref:Uncharacterized protein n=1 Tax=Solidesulfovibrio magneticus (strain ATCC 700980 / DSM 13731 / RS-1) TaxID=573370 RepID=C4XUG9_SOLM1|nr:hypothetical protein DMR_p1_00040 [Solidesulfovibrio magneticus RS-1]